MPNLTIPINDVQYSVERPVVYDIVRQLLDITQISHKTPIAFYGDEGKSAQKNSTLYKDTLTENYWPYNEKVYIEVEEDYEKDRILSTAIRRPENLTVFKDEALGVFIKPVYSSSDVSIQFKYRATDKNQANRWRNDMRTRVSMMRDINLHELVYHYHLPEAFVNVAKEVHRLRETVAGYGESFDDYFSKNLVVNASVVSNFAGNGELWAISERQIRVQGYFDFEDVPDKPEKDGDHDNWTVTVNYRFKYDKPIECHMQYPLMVHQQILDEAFWSPQRAYSLEDQSRIYTLSAGQFNHFESDTANLIYRSNRGIAIPAYDEFVPGAILPATLRVFTAMAGLEASDTQALFNLRELGDVGIDPEILRFLAESEYAYLGTDYASVFCLCLYENQSMKSRGVLSVDADLNVRAITPLDLRKCYHVRLSLVADFSYLKPEVLRRLSKYPMVAIKLISAINAALVDCGGQRDLKKTRLSWKEIQQLNLVGDINYLNLSNAELDALLAFLIDYAVKWGLTSLSLPIRRGSMLDPYPSSGGSNVNGRAAVPLDTLTREQHLYWLRNQGSLVDLGETRTYLNQTLFVVTSENY